RIGGARVEQELCERIAGEFRIAGSRSGSYDVLRELPLFPGFDLTAALLRGSGYCRRLRSRETQDGPQRPGGFALRDQARQRVPQLLERQLLCIRRRDAGG